MTPKALADYLARRLEGLRPKEAGTARVLRELVKWSKARDWDSPAFQKF